MTGFEKSHQVNMTFACNVLVRDCPHSLSLSLCLCLSSYPFPSTLLVHELPSMKQTETVALGNTRTPASNPGQEPVVVRLVLAPA